MKTYSKQPQPDSFLLEAECEICGGTDHRDFLNCRTFAYVKCSSCGHVYQNPMPQFPELKNRYDADYFNYELENDKNFFNLMLAGLSDIRFSEIEKKYNQRKNTKHFLDVGCATGMLVEYMQNRGWSAEGIEICKDSALYGRRTRNVAIHIGTLEEINFPNEYFAFIHFSHLIEHLINPSAFIREVFRILQPGGYIVVVTPNVRGLQARLLGASWRSAIADHMHLFSDKTLKRLLTDSGFIIVRKQTWGGIAKGLAPKFVKAPLDRLAKAFGFGDVVLFLAQKPYDGK
jgi:2-polyprenyl-3-methyl-5-hydroxy-6-metoxy-1,4-benzoquinol methylase